MKTKKQKMEFVLKMCIFLKENHQKVWGKIEADSVFKRRKLHTHYYRIFLDVSQDDHDRDFGKMLKRMDGITFSEICHDFKILKSLEFLTEGYKIPFETSGCKLQDATNENRRVKSDCPSYYKAG